MAKFINGVTTYEDWRQEKDENKVYKKKLEIVNRMLEKKRNGEQLTIFDEIQLVQQIQVSTLGGKLEYFSSVSTSVLMNRLCQFHAKKDGCICKECYAANSLSNYTGLMLALEINYIIMNSFEISEKAWSTLVIPTINGATRLESHGDVATVTAAKNMIYIIRTHNFLVFGVWSKNFGIWFNAFAELDKPGNMVFIASSEKINQVVKLPEKIIPYVDHIFTVYTKEFAEQHNIEINCGKRKCKDCMLCYTIGCKVYYINELLK